jgi:hypothetical protein
LFIRYTGINREASTLVDRERAVGACIISKIYEHANDRAVAKFAGSWGVKETFAEWDNRGGILGGTILEAKKGNDTVSESLLSNQEGPVVLFCNGDTKVSREITVFREVVFVAFEGGQEGGDIVFVAGTDDGVTDVHDNNQIIFEEETGVNIGGDKASFVVKEVTEVVVPEGGARRSP